MTVKKKEPNKPDIDVITVNFHIKGEDHTVNVEVPADQSLEQVWPQLLEHIKTSMFPRIIDKLR